MKGKLHHLLFQIEFRAPEARPLSTIGSQYTNRFPIIPATMDCIWEIVSSSRALCLTANWRT